jgi:hypothetical protein
MQEPGARSQEPGARSQEPGARIQEPGVQEFRSSGVQNGPERLFRLLAPES